MARRYGRHHSRRTQYHQAHESRGRIFHFPLAKAICPFSTLSRSHKTVLRPQCTFHPRLHAIVPHASVHQLSVEVPNPFTFPPLYSKLDPLTEEGKRYNKN